MSKINEIEQKLLSIDSSRFHKLVNLYLNKKHNYNIQDTGTKNGEDKPIKGTPDTLIPLENGNYVFIEYTTQKTNIVDKFLDDLKKDVNEEKTGIPLAKIEKIIFGCNSTLKSDETEILKKECLKYGIKCEIITLSSISNDLFNHFPGIADSELGISIDTRQILDIDDFIKSNDSNPLSSPLGGDILNRDEKIVEITESINKNDITIIHGNPGVGKTKIAIESLKILKKEELIIKTLISKNIDMYNDIQTYFGGDGNYIIFLDDAFRYKTSIIPHLLDLLCKNNENRKIKLIFTIRDYTLDEIRRITEKFNTNFITIDKLEDKEIIKILEQIYGIKNHNYLDKIVKIAKGNPRIAVLGGIASLKDGFDAIQNAEGIYEIYFSGIKKDIDGFSDNHKKVIVMVSFFRVLDKSNTEIMNKIYDVLNINEFDFWLIVRELNNFEIFDLYENEIVKVSDQIFSSYLFYDIVFKERTVDFSFFLDNFYISHTQKVIETLNSILGIFYSENLFSTIKDIVKNFYKISDDSLKQKIIHSFSRLLEVESMVFIKKYIDGLESNNNIDFNDFYKINHNSTSNNNILDLIGNLGFSEHYKDIIDLFLSYIEKVNSISTDAIIEIKKSFLYQIKSSYLVESTLVSEIIKRTNSGENELFSRIFIEVGFLYLGTEFENNYTEGKTFYFQKFPLYINDKLKEIRSNIINHISILYKSVNYKDRITKKILDYIKTSAFNYNDSEILKIDLNVFDNFINENLNSKILRDCILVNKLNKKFSNIGGLNKEILNDFLNEESYILYDLITEDYLDKREDIEYEDFDSYKKEKVINYIDNYKFEEYLSLFEKLRDVINYIKKYDKYKAEIFNSSIKIIFDYIFEKNKDLFFKIFTLCVEKGNFLEISYPDYLVGNLLKIISDNELYLLLNNNKYINKEIFIISFFRNLPEDKINSFYIGELLKFYQENNYIPGVWLDFLIKYHKYEKNIIGDVIHEIVKKVELGEKSGYHSLDGLFNPHSDINKNLIMYFNSNLVVLKKAYFICENFGQHVDYDGHNLKLINESDPNFIIEYLDFIINSKDSYSRFDNDYKDLGFLWKDKKNIIKIIMHIYNTNIYDFQKARLLIGFFGKFNHSLENINKLEELKKDFIISFIQKNIYNKVLIDLIFLLISDFNQEDKLYFIEKLIEIDSSLDFFKRIGLESSYSSWSGSSVNYYTQKKDYYIKISNMLEKKGINYIEHRLEIQGIIDSYNKIIQDEKRKEFSED